VKNLNHILLTAEFAENQDYTRDSVNFTGSPVGLGTEVPLSAGTVNTKTIFTTNSAGISIIQIISDMIVNMMIIIR